MRGYGMKRDGVDGRVGYIEKGAKRQGKVDGCGDGNEDNYNTIEGKSA